MQDRRVRLEGPLAVDDRLEWLVFDLDELGGVARELPGGGDDRGDRLTGVPHPPDREGVVLDLVPGRGRELEERVGEDRDLIARERPVDALDLEGRRDVDGDDLRVRVGRADEMDVAHAVPAQIVEEDTLALDEPLVLLAGNRDAGIALLRRLDPLVRRRRHRAAAFYHGETMSP